MKSNFYRIFSLFMAIVMLTASLQGITLHSHATSPSFTNPITGTVQGEGYDESAGHNGIDLYPYNYGDPVYAVASGTITYSCPRNHTRIYQTGDDCCSVKILLDEPFTYNGYTYISAFYTHMSALEYDIYCGYKQACVDEYNAGERTDALPSGSVHVEAGQLIGYVGKGNAATHLHFSFETGEESDYYMMPNSEYYEVFGWGYNEQISANKLTYTDVPTYTSSNTLETLKAKFPDGKYWNGGSPDTVSSTPCTCHGRGTCGYASDCRCNGYIYNGSEWAWQCMGFAYRLQQLVYGGDPYNWSANTDYTSAMANLKPGDVVRYSNHSIFITYVSGDYIEYADCNSDGHCKIRWGAHDKTKSSLQSTFRYAKHAPTTLEGGTVVQESCTCSTSYAGTYKCTTSSLPLTIRSGHGTSFSSIGTILSGATVTVTKANGTWAHVTYNGISGYASMEYLAKPYVSDGSYPVPFNSYPLSDDQHAADAYDAPGGNHIGYIYGTDYCTIKAVYSNGYCLVNCPWEGSTKDVYAYTGAFLNTAYSPVTKTAEAYATTYIRLSSSTTLGWIDPGDTIVVVDDTQSGRTQIIYPNSYGTHSCAWVEKSALVHTHTAGAAATCTSPQVCTTCDAIIVNATGHSAGAAATCTSPQTCTKCGTVLNDEKGHTPGTAATCTTAQTCTTCGVTINAKLGHSMQAIAAKASTCEVQGNNAYYKCTRCNKYYKDANGTTVTTVAAETLALASCTWNSGTVTTQPTCTGTGIKTYTCTVCGKTKTETVAAKGHTPGAAATCTTAQTCTTCGVTINAKLGHSMQAIAAKASTCEVQGNNAYYKCTRCNKYYKDANGTTVTTVAAETLPLASCTWNSGTVTTQPTCTGTGIKTYTCTVCGKTKTETVAAKGHSAGAAATCTTAQTCTTCGVTINAKLGHSMQAIAAKASTCEVQGNNAYYKCTRCNKYYKDANGTTVTTVAAETLPLITCSWDNGVVTKEPTTSETGIKTYTCTVCGKTKTEIIPKLVDENSPKILISDIEGMPGDTVTVTVSLKNNPGIASMKLKIAYGSELTLTAVEYNTAIGGQSQQPQSMASPVTLNWFNGSANSTGDFVFATLTFKISDNATEDSICVISATFNPNDVYDVDLENVDFAVQNGSITVTSYIPGDINGDGEVNNKDLTVLFRYLSDWDIEVNEKALDVNGDGDVNNKDLTILFRYLSDWDVEIH